MNLVNAVIKNDVEQLTKLLVDGADPNLVEDKAKVTLLHYAAQNDSLEVARKLVKAGARWDSITEDGYTPLDIARLVNCSRMVEFLSQFEYMSKDR